MEAVGAAIPLLGTSRSSLVVAVVAEPLGGVGRDDETTTIVSLPTIVKRCCCYCYVYRIDAAQVTHPATGSQGSLGGKPPL